MRPFSYTRPESVSAAVEAFVAAGAGARYRRWHYLYDLMKLDIERPAHLIDVTAIRGLKEIDSSGDRLRFEALAPMSEVATDRVVLRDYPVLAESLSKAASQQLRNMATVGGNLLQRTRCLYFRNGAGGTSVGNTYPRNKREPGSGCAAIGGLDRGQAVLWPEFVLHRRFAGDWPVALVALDAHVEVHGREGARSLPVAELYRLPGTTPHVEFALAPDEMITAIVVPKTRAGRHSTYHKIRDRESYAFALASAAVALDLEKDTVREARVALGGVATRPWRATAAENLLVGGRLTRDTAMAAGLAAMAEAQPGRHNGFKIELAARTVADALMIAASRKPA